MMNNNSLCSFLDELLPADASCCCCNSPAPIVTDSVRKSQTYLGWENCVLTTFMPSTMKTTTQDTTVLFPVDLVSAQYPIRIVGGRSWPGTL